MKKGKLEGGLRPSAATPALLRLRNLIAALNRVLLSMDLKDLPGRVREIPNVRTARFYTTLGLLSHPARFDGRRAMYGRKHLLELLAIKRLQLQNKSIREIQDILRDATLARLESIAGVDSAVIHKALLKAARDPALDLWPRPGVDQPHPDRVGSDPGTSGGARKGRPDRGGSTAVLSHRIARGVYLIVDPSQSRLTAGEIKQRIERTVIRL